VSAAFSLRDKVAIVTGGSQGIGLAIVNRLAANGATAINADLREGAQPTSADLFVATDVSDENKIAELIEIVVEKYGRIDVLVNNAGIHLNYDTIADSNLSDYERCYRINTLGVVAGIKHAAPHMPAGSSIINIASLAATLGISGMGSYTASKLPVIGLTRTAAVELGSKGIRVNAICPGSVQTPMAEAEGGEELLEVERRAVPLGRIARPEEVAALVHFLAADDCGFLNGQAINLCGGLSAGWSETLWEKLAS